MLAVRITFCADVPFHEKERVLERINQAADQMVMDGIAVLDTSIACDPVCTDDEGESEDGA